MKPCCASSHRREGKVNEEFNSELNQFATANRKSFHPLERLGMSDPRIKWIISKIAEFSDDLNSENVLACLEQSLPDIGAFLKESGPTRVLFSLYQVSGKMRVQFVTGTDFGESTIYFLKTMKKDVTAANIEQQVLVGSLEKEIIGGLANALQEILLPAIEGQSVEEAGDESKPKEISKTVTDGDDELVENLNHFAHQLNLTKKNLDSTIVLRLPDKQYQIPNRATHLQKALDNANLVEHYQSVMESWCREVEKMIAENDLVRRESDKAGPAVELDYWKQRMAKFNMVVDSMKRDDGYKTVLAVLRMVKNPALKDWLKLDGRVTDSANEAKDNVKYLYSVERFYLPLYKSNPLEIMDGLEPLLQSIKMMHNVARYYNTPDHITTFLTKVSNQMVLQCKKYLTELGSFWNQPHEELLQRLAACIQLNLTYQHVYHELRDDTTGKPFKFSEKSIFGNFDLFCTRLTMLIELFSIVEQYKTIDAVHIEGFQFITEEYFAIYKEISSKTYDMLNFHEATFPKDYASFRERIRVLECKIATFIDLTFNDSRSTLDALRIVRQFEKILQQTSLLEKLDGILFSLFNKYAEEVEDVRAQYEKDKENPPLSRNDPPVAGKILWARHLLQRIEEPMIKFRDYEGVIKSPTSKIVIKKYNKIARALIEFETLYHEAWLETTDNIKSCLQASLLVQDHATHDYFVNFDHEVIQTLREGKFMQWMGLFVPERVTIIGERAEHLKRLAQKLQDMIYEYNKLVDMILPILAPLLSPLFLSLEKRMQPGLTSLTWSSLNCDMFVKDVTKEMENVSIILWKVTDIINNRIQLNLDAIGESVFLHFPTSFKEHLMTVDDFLAYQTKHIEEKRIQLDWKSEEIENATYDLANIFEQTVKGTDPYYETHIKELVAYYNQKTMETVRDAVRENLHRLHRKFFPRSSGSLRLAGIWNTDMMPVFRANLELNLPDVAIDPDLDKIQHLINRTAVQVIQITKGVFLWGQERRHAKREPKNMFFETARHLDIVRGSLQLVGTVSRLEEEIKKVIKTFDSFTFLWRDDKTEVITAFLASNPSMGDFENKISDFYEMEKRVDHAPNGFIVGPISIDSSPLKLSMKSEATMWKNLYGEKMNDKVRGMMDYILEYMEETQVVMSREINDLEDINNMMGTLEKMRQLEAEIDMKMAPIEDAYRTLQKYHVPVTEEELEQVDALHYNWAKLCSQSRNVLQTLLKIAPGMKQELVKDVQVFTQDVKKFMEEYKHNGPMVPGIKPRIAVDRLKQFQRVFAERERKWNTFSLGERLFGLPVTDYPELNEISKELKLAQKLYGLYTDVIETIAGYEEVLWQEIDIETMTNQLQDFQARCRKMPKALRDWEAYLELKKTIEDFSNTLPLLQSLALKSMRPRHWEKIGRLLQVRLEWQNPNFKVKNLMEHNLLHIADDIEEICGASSKEADIEQKLNRIKVDWEEQSLSFSEFKARGEITLTSGETAELMLLLEDTQMLLGSLMSNRYNGPFRAELQQWVHKLTVTQEIIEQWLQVQALWIYLEAVFSGGDIARQLPQEAKRFTNIDKSWMKIMDAAHSNPNVIGFVVREELLRNLLPHLQESLEACQKSLAGYLEAKRALFPRFFFVSDAQLLEILGQGSDPHSIQSHLVSIFDNLATAKFDKVHTNHIIGMVSKEGEQVALEEPVVAQGNIEDWLNMLKTEMQRTLKSIVRGMASNILSVFAENDKEKFESFIQNHPAQVGILGIQFYWTAMSEEALTRAKTEKSALSQVAKNFAKALSQLVEFTTKKLTSTERTAIETLITIHIHQVDISLELMKSRLKSPEDFEWLKQTRLYWRPDIDDTVIAITDVDFLYQYEYLGVAERLVITPLTDRIYISCSQAMNMYYGSAPAGPAGTGKTETTKDMGRTCGRFFVTINCSDQMDYRAMGKMYKGIAQSGIWCGFDEINRIDLAVLSVVAAQIACVFNALKERKMEFTFVDGTTIPLTHTAGIFVTMNPGYAGRTELPENMKALFRTIAVVVPDRQIICRVRLAASGFQENELLAKKFFTLYRLCEEQLSKQVHYDFGLRNILSVLRTCGSQKRTRPNDSETHVLMRVLRDMNLSKLVDEDEPLFLSLVGDLFPGIDVEKQNYPDLQAELAKGVADLGIINTSGWNLKVIQIYEQYQVRHGLCIMGPSGSGKSSAIKVLGKALHALEGAIVELRMNPKAITATQMFGKLDVSTNDWTDGIFSALWRRGCKSTKKMTWIELDGPVDAVWIENLNTVLDDTRTLTLANGDRILMPPNMKIMFEAADLNNASPATVSRLGMVYMGLSALGWRPMVEAWIKQRGSSSETNIIMQAFESFLDDMFLFLSEHTAEKMDIINVNKVATTLKLLNGLLPTNAAELPRAVILRIVTFALMWSVAGVLEMKDQARVHDWMQKKGIEVPELPEDSEETVYEYYVNPEGNWEHWKSQVSPFAYPKQSEPNFNELFIPTVDNVRCGSLIKLIAKQKLPVLLIGESGTAKTVTIMQYLHQQNPEETLTAVVSFSSATTPYIFQRIIESRVEKRMGTTYGPPAGKKMDVFIDDINMPFINEWGDQITNEIVRQLIEQKGIYCLDKPGEFHGIVDLQFLAAMNQPGGGRNDIPQRLKRQFAIFNVTLPSNTSVDRIYGTILTGHFVAERGFAPEVTTTAFRLSKMTRALWQQTKRKMLPTPAKFHYIFNLRDLSRIAQGIVKAESDVVTDRLTLLRLWKHECDRVLPDKFTNEDDLKWFRNHLRHVLMEEVKDEALVDDIIIPGYFVDFMRDAEEPEDPEEEAVVPKVYEFYSDIVAIRERVAFYMSQYNEQFRRGQLDLVLFDFALQHMMRRSRIIRSERGNALLVGVGGSGKQSLTRLASFIAGYQTFQIVITKMYNVNNLMDDLKILYRKAAFESPVTFLFTDNEVKEEGFLEYLNMILCSGEVAGLFPKDELDVIMEDARVLVKKTKPGFIDTNENLYKFFIDRVRDRLHVVLCFSPVGEKFSSRSQKFPGIISGCTIDWFTSWPAEALRATAEKFIINENFVCSPEEKEKLMSHMCHVHVSVGESTLDYFDKFRRSTYVTPKSYLSFIDSYKKIYAKKHTEIRQMADRVKTGLSKLMQAAEDIAVMKVELQKKEVNLAAAQKELAKMIIVITEQTAEAEKVKTEVQAVKDKCQLQADTIAAEKSSAEKDLEAARPALEEAVSALNQIKPGDIATLKKLQNPPNLIKRIMDGVIILNNLPVEKIQLEDGVPYFRPSWASAGRLLADVNFLNNLLNFKKENINDETCELLEPYLQMHDFTKEAAQKSSGNVSGLCTWVSAMSTYHSVAKYVGPKIEALAVAESSLKVAKKKLSNAEELLAEKQAELDKMQAEYDAAMVRKQVLQDDAELTKKRMEAAEALINGLAGERTRWTEQSEQFDDEIICLLGDVAQSAAFLSYSGPFNQEYRQDITEKRWKKDLILQNIPFSRTLNVSSFLANENTIGDWQMQGLPMDELSIQNAIIVTTSNRYPLLVDPQGQAKEWIKSKEEVNGLVVTNLNHKYFRNSLEDCIALGKPLLIEDCGNEIDPVLDNVLEKNFVKSGRTLKVLIGDKDVEVDPSFMLYITTKIPNPSFSPETYAKCSVIDFTVTRKGLEDQLLGLVILKEKAELEETRKALLEEINDCKKTASKCEEDLLVRLSNTEGNLLDDASLIEVLAKTKEIASDVRDKLANARDTEIKITAAREEYRPVATRGSILYFVITELSNVNCMYQTSLASFLRLFDECMDLSEKSLVPAKRIKFIINYATFYIFKFIQRGLYERHKLMYALLLALKIDLNAGAITSDGFDLLLRGGAALDISSVPPKPYKWVQDDAWLNLNALSKLGLFNNVIDSFMRNEDGWKAWFDLETPEKGELPDGYSKILDIFNKLLLVRTLRIDRAMIASTSYIIHSLGQSFVEGIPLDLAATVVESSALVPIICLLSMGSDPTSSIQDLAKKQRVDLRIVSMGQGQEVIARKLASDLIHTGGWLLLQNCHLAGKFMDELEANVCNEGWENVSEDFRLWVTTEPTEKFPINLLQLSIKLTNEPPEGLKAGLRRSYAWLNQDSLEQIDKTEWRKILYAACFMHSTVIERRKYGPLGWCIPYEFNHTDLVASISFLQNHFFNLELKKPISWKTVRYMVCEVQYGGRITDDYDKRLLVTYGAFWLDANLYAPGFEFYKGYNCPDKTMLSEWRDFIEDLPLIDTPEIYGMNPNAELTSRAAQANMVLGEILNVQPKDSSGSGGESRESIVLKVVADLLSKLPSDFSKNQVKGQVSKIGGVNPLNICLVQEIDRLQAVLVISRSTMLNLQLAIAGTIIMSEELQTALNSLYDARVPPRWVKASWPSPTLGFWFTDFIERHKQLHTWLWQGRPNVFWLTGMFNPQGFLTAMRQETTRAHQGWSLDAVVLASEVLRSDRDEIRKAPDSGVYIYGLFLEGAAWDRRAGNLIEAPPKMLYLPMPVIHVTAINSVQTENPRFYNCPVYKLPNRNALNYVFDVTLKTNKPVEHWILRGVALLCSKV